MFYLGFAMGFIFGGAVGVMCICLFMCTKARNEAAGSFDNPIIRDKNNGNS